ncbi:MAG: tripartite tricarboxylate transporter substrate binding protein [Natronospirillum sp.]|uniref:tripartite tricarboxylate transporter substrate binding protein n=1 Tax=Natronospirillum sp. TaxID=2812955 RepID=UPI002600D833|nr:tripartite tricarboxylate transporter substrate binding protein [Natronospirillum sp.]MCH8552206.1 tripartite tricarboxylate transporter substrate binding protein [Natronospirillum sp.]
MTTIIRLVALAGAMLLSLNAISEDFPNRPITMLIGFTAGGSTDVQGQVLAEIMAEQLGQPVNVVHFPGQGSSLAAAMLAESRDQGYVFQYGLSLPFVLTPLTSPTSYDYESFRFVAGLTLHQSALVTAGDSLFASLEDLIEYARETGELSYATQTVQDRILMEAIARQEGIRLNIVPTSGGSEMAPLVISGEVALGYSGGTHSGFTDSGEMRVLAALTRERLADYPDVPTVSELGYPHDLHAFRVLVTPADTPDHHIEILASAARAATRDERFVAVAEDVTRMPVVYIPEPELDAVFEQQVSEHEQMLRE